LLKCSINKSGWLHTLGRFSILSFWKIFWGIAPNPYTGDGLRCPSQTPSLRGHLDCQGLRAPQYLNPALTKIRTVTHRQCWKQYPLATLRCTGGNNLSYCGLQIVYMYSTAAAIGLWAICGSLRPLYAVRRQQLVMEPELRRFHRHYHRTRAFSSSWGHRACSWTWSGSCWSVPGPLRSCPCS